MLAILQSMKDLWLFIRKEILIRNAIKQLRELSDNDLEDMGLSRHTLTHTVRYGRGTLDHSAF